MLLKVTIFDNDYYNKVDITLFNESFQVFMKFYVIHEIMD